MATILIAEDDPEIQSRYYAEFRNSPHTLVVTSNGREALAAIQRSKPDLVITDLEMPMMSGYKLLAALHERPALAGLPIVVCSSNVRVWSKPEEFGPNVTAVCPKPFARGVVRAMVERHLPRLVQAPRLRDLSGRAVLLVDDNAEGSARTRALLRECGADTTVAATLTEARRLIGERTFDVVIVDAALERENRLESGIDLLREIESGSPWTRTVLFTAGLDHPSQGPLLKVPRGTAVVPRRTGLDGLLAAVAGES